ncbi:GNAT family N-acetyltransferase [Nocardioides sp. KR10-350]|uniref:GNAT family N-acetyltransferase n=1 Tax=Nocardioides cheoyonin TaxID=3156615 RepID=UPI0032B435AD
MQEAIINDDLKIPPLHETLADLEESIGTWDTYVVRKAGRLVGSVRGRLVNGDEWEIGRLMVAPDLQGGGLGRTLLEHIEAVAPSSVRLFWLFTGAKSERNHRFYKRAGFRLRPDLPSPGPTAVTLTKARR